MTQEELIAALKAAAPMSWPTIWSAVLKHRAHCLDELRSTADELLANPKTTRRLMREALARRAREIGEKGPAVRQSR